MSEIQREKKNCKVPRTEAGVETDLEITQRNYGVNHSNWCIKS